MRIHVTFLRFITLAIISTLAIAVHGYHPGAEDDSVYLSAIKLDLDPALYPHDSDFFKLQLQATLFDNLIAGSIRLTHLPVEWAVLLWHFGAILLVLWGCLRLSSRCFEEPCARWASVGLVAALLTLPVAGTALYLIDQYLHPRAIATGLVLAAIVAVLDGRRVLAAVLLVCAAVMHPIMAALGISFCVFLSLEKMPPLALAGAFLPLDWIFEPVSSAWRQAANSSTCYFLSRWEWFEWLGIFAPFLVLWSIRQRSRSPVASRLASALICYGLFQFAVAVAILTPSSLERFRSFQPMRYLHLIYLLMAVLGGGWIGQRILRSSVYRWVLLFAPLTFGMFCAQRDLFAGTEHLELPGMRTSNAWVEAFQWVRLNTPAESLFALDPQYVRARGEDYHSFRAIAERSMMADAVKDAPVVTQVPRLAPRWLEETQARAGWATFRKPDFERLRERYGVSWVIVERPGVPDLNCPFSNAKLLVCRLD